MTYNKSELVAYKFGKMLLDESKGLGRDVKLNSLIEYMTFLRDNSSIRDGQSHVIMKALWRYVTSK